MQASTTLDTPSLSAPVKSALAPRKLLFLLFFLSGFCGLLYQVVWTRMAFASFGIITPVLSVVISVFMLGLSLGAWAGGRWIGPLAKRTGLSAVIFYALAEFIIGLGAFAVPRLFGLSEDWLLSAGQANSVRYLGLSALALAGSILPWCLFMGATFPLMMAFVRERDSQNSESFSYLYLANVIGAMAGTSLTAVILIETLGFRHTLWVAAGLNFTIAAISCWLGCQRTAGGAARALTNARGGLNPDLRVRISDDRPFNEYFLLRRWGVLNFKTPPSSAPATSF
jgi:spermidine synthase